MSFDISKALTAVAEKKTLATFAAATTLCTVVLFFPLPAQALTVPAEYPAAAIKLIGCIAVMALFLALWVFYLYPRYTWDTRLQCNRRKDGVYVCPSCQAHGRMSLLRKGARYYNCPTVGCAQKLLDPDAPPPPSPPKRLVAVKMPHSWMSQ